MLHGFPPVPECIQPIFPQLAFLSPLQQVHCQISTNTTVKRCLELYRHLLSTTYQHLIVTTLHYAEQISDNIVRSNTAKLT